MHYEQFEQLIIKKTNSTTLKTNDECFVIGIVNIECFLTRNRQITCEN